MCLKTCERFASNPIEQSAHIVKYRLNTNCICLKGMISRTSSRSIRSVFIVGNYGGKTSDITIDSSWLTSNRDESSKKRLQFT